MKRGLVYLVFVTNLMAFKYAVVIRDVAYNNSGWRAVADTLVIRYDGKLFFWSDSVGEVLDSLRAYQPDYIAFVARPHTDANSFFVRKIHEMTRRLDEDPYGDAIWGIVTGFEPEDAMRAIKVDSLIIKTLLGGFMGYTGWVYQGIGTSESEHNRIAYTFPDGTTLDTVSEEHCPTDRTVMLVSYLNYGIDDSFPGHPRIQGPVDIFITSGHANVNVWQLHYPDPDDEGFFRSVYGRLFGDPHSGPDTNIVSLNPKVYYAPGNCYIGNPSNTNNMVYAWFHKGGAIQMVGYIVETWYGYMGWGVGSYFFPLQNTHTFQESFFANNQSLLYDLYHHTPGTDSTGLEYDKDNVAIYGDPAQIVKIYPVKTPLYSQWLDIHPGIVRDTFEFRIRVNYDNVHISRHPFAFLPYRIESVMVETTNAIDVVITDNFVLMHVWHSGEPALYTGDERFVRFTAKRAGVPVAERTYRKPLYLRFNVVRLDYDMLKLNIDLREWVLVTISLYDISGRKVSDIFKGPVKSKTILWTPEKRIFPGIYFVSLEAPGIFKSKKLLLGIK